MSDEKFRTDVPVPAGLGGESTFSTSHAVVYIWPRVYALKVDEARALRDWLTAIIPAKSGE